MTSQKIFNITRKLVFYAYALSMALGIAFAGIEIFILASRHNTTVDTSGAFVNFEVKIFNHAQPRSEEVATYQKLARLSLIKDRATIAMPTHSMQGYYTTVMTLVFMGAIVYGLYLLNGIFSTTTLAEPFTVDNAKRILNIGLIFIGCDLLRILNYILFNVFIRSYFPQESPDLVTNIGSGIVIGLLVICLSIIYRRGVDIYSESKLTI